MNSNIMYTCTNICIRISMHAHQHVQRNYKGTRTKKYMYIHSRVNILMHEYFENLVSVNFASPAIFQLYPQDIQWCAHKNFRLYVHRNAHKSCVCMHDHTCSTMLYAHVYKRKHMCIFTNTSMFVCIYIYTYLYVYVYICTLTYLYTGTSACVRIYVYTSMQARMWYKEMRAYI